MLVFILLFTFIFKVINYILSFDEKHSYNEKNFTIYPENKKGGSNKYMFFLESIMLESFRWKPG